MLKNNWNNTNKITGGKREAALNFDYLDYLINHVKMTSSAYFFFIWTRAKVSADVLSSIAPRFQQSDMHPACERSKVPAGNLSKNFSPISLPPKDTPHESRGHGGMAGTSPKVSRVRATKHEGKQAWDTAPNLFDKIFSLS